MFRNNGDGIKLIGAIIIILIFFFIVDKFFGNGGTKENFENEYFRNAYMQSVDYQPISCGCKSKKRCCLKKTCCSKSSCCKCKKIVKRICKCDITPKYRKCGYGCKKLQHY